MAREPDPFAELDRRASGPDPTEEERPCSYCGEPLDDDQLRWCSRECRRADESDRG